MTTIRNTVLRSLTVIIGTVVALTFLFGFGNVLGLGPRLGVSAYVALLVAPAVDLSVLAGRYPVLGVGEISAGRAALPEGIDTSRFARLRGVLPGITEQADIAEVIAYHTSDAARSVTGTQLVVDRGTVW